MPVHRMASNWAFLIIDPFRIDELPEGCGAAALVPFGLENEAHLMPQIVCLRQLDPSQQDTVSDWIERHANSPDTSSAFIFADGQANEERLLSHLRRGLVVWLSRAQRCLLRYYDPGVFRHFEWLFDDAQLAAFCGPLTRWLFCDEGRWRTLVKPDVAHAPVLRFDKQLSARLGRIGALNSVFQELELPAAPHESIALFRQADGYLARAQAKGWQSEADWVAFTQLCLECHPRFDEHPRVVRLLKQIDEDDCAFADAICAVDDEFWQTVADELSAETSQTQQRDITS